MENFTPDFFSGLFSIIIIDLVLAGDNAVVIGLAAGKLPKKQQKNAILWGTAGAVIIRAVLTLMAVYLLLIPGLMLIGGCLLIWIAYRLITEKRERKVKSATSFLEALRTIIVADAVMGLDNVLAVAGAAHGNMVLVILGLLISVPIVVWGSTMIVQLTERYPVLIYVGAGVLALTAAKMITGEQLLPFFAEQPVFRWAFILVTVAGVIVAGIQKRKAAAVT